MPFPLQTNPPLGSSPAFLYVEYTFAWKYDNGGHVDKSACTAVGKPIPLIEERHVIFNGN